MNDQNKAFEDKILDYIDGNLSAAEAREVEDKIASSAETRKVHQELLSIHNGLKQLKLEQPSKNFTQLVMGRLEQKVVHSTLSIRNGILLLIGTLAAMAIATLLVSAGVFDGSSTINLNEVDLAKKYIPQSLPAISFNGKIVVNTIIILNLILAWLILDRAILKPLFQRRMESQH
jgi:hypothetical protein